MGKEPGIFLWVFERPSFRILEILNLIVLKSEDEKNPLTISSSFIIYFFIDLPKLSVPMTSRIFVLHMYFCPRSYFLTNEDISLKFWETTENFYAIFFEGCKKSMTNCFKTAFLLKIQISIDQTDVH